MQDAQIQKLEEDVIAARLAGNQALEEAKLRELIALAPFSYHKHQLAQLLEKQGQAVNELALYKEILHPVNGASTLQSDTQVLLRYAELTKEAEEFEEMEWALREILRVGPTTLGTRYPKIDKSVTGIPEMWATAYLIVGNDYSGRDEQKAIEYINKSLGMRLGDGVAHFYLAFHLDNAKDYDQAILEYKRAKAFSPNNADLVAAVDKRLPYVERVARRKREIAQGGS